MRLPFPILLFAATLVGIATPAATRAAEPVNPYPREVLAVEKAAEWTFGGGPAGWTATHDCRVEAAGGNLKITSTGNDPYLYGPAVKAEGPVTLSLRIKSTSAGTGRIFWVTDTAPHFTEEQAAGFDIDHDGRWHEYQVLLPAGGTITRLRLDPSTGPGAIEIERMELMRVRMHPLELLAVEQAPGKLFLDIRNHSNAGIDLDAGGQRFTVEARKDRRISILDTAAFPFESRTILIQPQGLPPLARTIFLYRPNIERAWLTLKSPDGLVVRVAPDGSGARLVSSGTVVAVIAPLVGRDGSAIPLRASPQEPGLVLTADGVKATIGIKAGEVNVTIESDKPVEGPVVRAQGSLEAGVLAGLEYLGKGERSSSDLDIETPERFRHLPDPLKVTMPLMACITDRGATAITWTDMALRPCFAAPNFFDGAADHRMALRGTNIEATILVRRGLRIEDAILWAVQKRGLPPLPQPPRSPEAQAKLCLDGINGPIKGEGGWGHCAEPTWQRQPFVDIASTIWRLTGQAPDLPKLVLNGSHIRNDSIYFVTGRAAEWLAVRGDQVKRTLATQKEDGSFRYAGKYLRGHFEDTASGHCAASAAILLEFAHETGDAAARDAGLKTLDYMKRFTVPRGAQVWELSLHTPDILASARLVHAYVRGYQLTGNTEYLAEARRWAISGLPFVYQWSARPVMLYATIPVFGATNWQGPNWMGLPVQWCGEVYAYSLALLAPHDKTLDWAKLARGILISAQEQQAPDGPVIGCLADSFDLAAQRRNGPFINPAGLVSLEMALDGKVDSLAVTVEGGRRILAPFPVTIKDGKAVIQGRAGTTYQVLIDGQRIVDVKSAGTDIVPLQ
ncbi:MAG: hypothetical protein NTY65_07880 [Planctomycetota bacterium]|nr:hypothetical protein [Planctomycetota bacterium]